MDPFNSDSLRTLYQFVPFAALGASLLGSGHCIAMCGGLMISVTKTRSSLILYHLGRLMGYLTLGALAGCLGQQIFNSFSTFHIPELTAILLGLSFVYMGIQIGLGKAIHLFRLPSPLLKQLHRWGGKSPWIVGLLSAILPCGWLHTFVLGAITLESPWKGAAYLFCFWLGTLPALSLASFASTRALRPLFRHSPKLAALLLITLGIGTLSFKMRPTPNHSSCHESMEH